MKKDNSQQKKGMIKSLGWFIVGIIIATVAFKVFK